MRRAIKRRNFSSFFSNFFALHPFHPNLSFHVRLTLLPLCFSIYLPLIFRSTSSLIFEILIFEIPYNDPLKNRIFSENWYLIYIKLKLVNNIPIFVLDTKKELIAIYSILFDRSFQEENFVSNINVVTVQKRIETTLFPKKSFRVQREWFEFISRIS